MKSQILIHTSVQDANTHLDILVARSPIDALDLIIQTYRELETDENPRNSLRKGLARAGRNALKVLQNGQQTQESSQ